MIKSMTGFGRWETATEERKVVVELKSVNHRYCDITIKLPKKLSFFEAGIRSLLKSYIGRGKVDVSITCEEYQEGKGCVRYHEDTAKEYLEYLTHMGERFQLENDIKVSHLSRYPEVFTLEEQGIDEEGIWHALEDAVRKAAEKFVETRRAEGENLCQDIRSKLNNMSSMIAFIEERSPQILMEYREKLTGKVKELLEDAQIDQGILATELTVYADKICVDEETVRLKSHIENMEKTLSHGDNVGRKLDFIAQEMNREANTILSKSSDLAVTNRAIDLKTEIEKVREQIQNIE